MKASLRLLAVFMLLASITAYFSKPSDEQCKKVAKREVLLMMEQKLESVNTPLIEGKNWAKLARVFAEPALDVGLTVNDNVLWKSIVFNNNGQLETVGWGAFDQVYIRTRQ